MLMALVVSLLPPLWMGHSVTEVDRFLWRSAYLGFAMVFAKAWWTTRKPSQYRNLWAVAGSSITLGGGLYLLWQRHSSFGMASRGLIAIILGGVGLFLFLRGGAPLTVQSETSADPTQPCAT
jgi:hypothetical protein